MGKSKHAVRMHRRKGSRKEKTILGNTFSLALFSALVTVVVVSFSCWMLSIEGLLLPLQRVLVQKHTLDIQLLKVRRKRFLKRSTLVTTTVVHESCVTCWVGSISHCSELVPCFALYKKCPVRMSWNQSSLRSDSYYRFACRFSFSKFDRGLQPNCIKFANTVSGFCGTFFFCVTKDKRSYHYNLSACVWQKRLGGIYL